MKKIICILFLAMSASAYGQFTVSDLISSYGKYDIGFTHKKFVDSSRSYYKALQASSVSIPRPVPVSIWYPAERSSSRQGLTISDYLQIHAKEREWEALPEEFLLSWFSYHNTPRNRKLLLLKSKAIKNLPPAKGKFPLIIYTPGLQGTSIENFALCEMLASHGYVIIAHPSRGSDRLFPDNAGLKDIDAQSRDITFLIGKSGALPNIDQDHIAVMGFSFGGLAGVMAQVKDDRIKAIVSLDGSIKYQYPKLQSSPYFDIKKVNVPLIHFAQKDIPDQVLAEDRINPSLNSDFAFFDDLQFSDAYAYKMHDLTHMNFNAMEIILGNRDSRQDFSEVRIIKSYQIVTEYILHFLETHFLKNNKTGSFLTNPPSANGFSQKLLSAKYKVADPLPFDFTQFNKKAQENEYRNLSELYLSVQEKHGSFVAEEARLNTVALQWLFSSSKPSFGIRLLQFAISLYPKSSNLYDSLGEGHLSLGQEKLALESFRKSLLLDASNQNAKNRIRQIEN